MLCTVYVGKCLINQRTQLVAHSIPLALALLLACSSDTPFDCNSLSLVPPPPSFTFQGGSPCSDQERYTAARALHQMVGDLVPVCAAARVTPEAPFTLPEPSEELQQQLQQQQLRQQMLQLQQQQREGGALGHNPLGAVKQEIPGVGPAVPVGFMSQPQVKPEPGVGFSGQGVPRVKPEPGTQGSVMQQQQQQGGIPPAAGMQWVGVGGPLGGVVGASMGGMQPFGVPGVVGGPLQALAGGLPGGGGMGEVEGMLPAGMGMGAAAVILPGAAAGGAGGTGAVGFSGGSGQVNPAAGGMSAMGFSGGGGQLNPGAIVAAAAVAGGAGRGPGYVPGLPWNTAVGYEEEEGADDEGEDEDEEDEGEVETDDTEEAMREEEEMRGRRYEGDHSLDESDEEMEEAEEEEDEDVGATEDLEDMEGMPAMLPETQKVSLGCLWFRVYHLCAAPGQDSGLQNRRIRDLQSAGVLLPFAVATP